MASCRKLAGLAWALSLLVLVFEAAPFVVRQIRTGLFPQVASGSRSGSGAVSWLAASRSPVAARRAGPTSYSIRSSGRAGAGLRPAADHPGRSSLARASSQRHVGTARRPAQEAMSPKASSPMSSPSVAGDRAEGLRAGPACRDPDRRGRADLDVGVLPAQLVGARGEGPAHAALLLSPGANAPARAAAHRAHGRSWPCASPRRSSADPAGSARSSAGGASLVAAVVLLSPAAAPRRTRRRRPRREATAGFFPARSCWTSYEQRLTRPPACAPHCVTTANVRLVVEGRRAALPGRGPRRAPWEPGLSPVRPRAGCRGRSPSTASPPKDSSRASPTASSTCASPAGTHQVTLAGPLPPRDSLTLQFGEKPRRASASAQGWQVDGIRDDGSADDSVQLSRSSARPARERAERPSATSRGSRSRASSTSACRGPSRPSCGA